MGSGLKQLNEKSDPHANPSSADVDPSDLYNVKIRVSDAASMFRRKCEKNERPYTQSAIKLLNSNIDEWENKVLKRLSSHSGDLKSGQVGNAIQSFIDYKELPKFVKYSERLPQMRKEDVEFWVKTIRDSTIEQLYDIGFITLSLAWQYVEMEVKRFFYQEKYDVIVSVAKNELDSYNVSQRNIHIFKGDTDRMPYGLTKEDYDDMREKIGTIMRHCIPKPEQ